jgi:hypothetical protein
MRSIYFSPSCRDTRDNLLGSSSAGLISGVLGIAAAVTIITPAGPPLLIVSLLFGGSATAVSTGTEARNYYSEPNKLAGRIQALRITKCPFCEPRTVHRLCLTAMLVVATQAVRRTSLEEYYPGPPVTPPRWRPSRSQRLEFATAQFYICLAFCIFLSYKFGHSLVCPSITHIFIALNLST